MLRKMLALVTVAVMSLAITVSVSAEDDNGYYDDENGYYDDNDDNGYDDENGYVLDLDETYDAIHDYYEATDNIYLELEELHEGYPELVEMYEGYEAIYGELEEIYQPYDLQDDYQPSYTPSAPSVPAVTTSGYADTAGNIFLELALLHAEYAHLNETFEQMETFYQFMSR